MAYISTYCGFLIEAVTARKIWLDLFRKQEINNGVAVLLTLDGYMGKNECVRSMQKYLEKECGYLLIGVILHGSVATGEEIDYSDCDVLAILRREVFESNAKLRHVAWRLFRAKKFMNKFDPLQHHGWFVLSEDDLLTYPEYYLPLEVLRRSKALFPPEGLKVRLKPIFDKEKNRESFQRLSMGVIRRLSEVPPIRNLYELKGLMSQFMLLPSLYVQVRDGRGVFKKDSFAAARRDFSVDLWSIMDEVSEIRESWEYRMSWITKWILSNGSVWRDLLAPRIAPRIPRSLKAILSEKFFKRMNALVIQMRDRLN